LEMLENVGLPNVSIPNRSNSGSEITDA